MDNILQFDKQKTRRGIIFDELRGFGGGTLLWSYLLI